MNFSANIITTYESITFNILIKCISLVAPTVKVDIVKDSEGKSQRIATVVGIVSWGDACGYAEYPDVLGRVTTVLDWVHSYLKEFR